MQQQYTIREMLSQKMLSQKMLLWALMACGIIISILGVV